MNYKDSGATFDSDGNFKNPENSLYNIDTLKKEKYHKWSIVTLWIIKVFFLFIQVVYLIKIMKEKNIISQ